MSKASFSINLLELEEPGEEATHLEAVKVRGVDDEILVLVSSVGGLVEGQRLAYEGMEFVIRNIEPRIWAGEQCFLVQ